jgi:hypothetical protein
MYVLSTLIIKSFIDIQTKFEPGARMILDAVLLSIAKISAMRQTSHAVAILPEMRLATGDGVMISHPVSKYEVWLTGNVDYGVIQYPVEFDNKGPPIYIPTLSIDLLCSEVVGRGRFSRRRVSFGNWTALSCRGKTPIRHNVESLSAHA